MQRRNSIQKIALVAILAALSYVTFTFIQFKIPLPGGDATSVHLGNMVPVLGALLFSGIYGGLGGAIGMTIGDVLDPVYVIYAPKTFILKLCIGLITGFVAKKLDLYGEEDVSKLRKKAAIAGASGLVFNAVFDPILGYFYKLLILGKPAAEITLTWNVASCVINAVVSLIVAVPLFIALRPSLKKYNFSKAVKA